MAELVPSHVQNGFARVYHQSRTVSPTQLAVAVESHAGHGRRGPANFEPCWREGGVVPRQSGSATGVASEVILRETVSHHPQWHEVGSRAFFCSASAALSAQGQQPGSSWCWKGGIIRG